MGGEKPRFSSRVPAKTCMTEINQYLMCQLCSGYLVDATGIIECQHTFCKSCILRYLDTNSYCPICDVQLNKAKPHLSLRADSTLQHLVYKLVPGLFVSEVRRRREFLSKLPTQDGISSDSSSVPGGSGTSASPITELEETEDMCALGLDDAVSLSLEYLKSRDEDTKANVVGAPATNKSTCSDKANDRRYLQCPAAVSVGLLKKFIRMKYGLSDDYRVDLLYDGDRDNNLENDLTLLDLAFIYKWKKAEPMCFHYQIFDRPVKAQLVRPGTKRPATFMMDEPPPDDDETASGPPSTSMTSKLARISVADSTSTNTNNNNNNNTTTGTSSQSNKRSSTTTNTTTTSTGNISNANVLAPSENKTEMTPPSPPRKIVKSPTRTRSITSEDREPSPPQTRSSLTLKLSKRVDTSISKSRRRSSTSSNASTRSEESSGNRYKSSRSGESKSSSSTCTSASSGSASSSPISPKDMPHPSLKISLKNKYHNNHHHHHHHHHKHHKHKSKDKEKKDKHKGHKSKGKTMVTRGDSKDETKEPPVPSSRASSHTVASNVAPSNSINSNNNNASVNRTISQTNIPKGTTITGTVAPSAPEPKQPANIKTVVKVPKLMDSSAGNANSSNGRQNQENSSLTHTTPTHAMTVPESVQLQVPKSVTLIPVNPNAPAVKVSRNQEKPTVNRNTFTHPITNKSLHQITVTEVPPPKVPMTTQNQQQQLTTPQQSQPPTVSSSTTITSRTYTDTSPGKHFNAPDGMEITKIYCDKNSSFEAAGKKLKGKGLDITISPSPMPTNTAPPMTASNNNNSANGNKGSGSNKKTLDESLTFTHKNIGQRQQPQHQPIQTSQKLLKQLGQNAQIQNTLRNLQQQGTKPESATKSRKSSLSIEAAKPGTVSSVGDTSQQPGKQTSHQYHQQTQQQQQQQHRKTIGNLDSSIAIYEVGSVRRTPTPPKEKGLVVTPIPNKEPTAPKPQNVKRAAEAGGKQQQQVSSRKTSVEKSERKKDEHDSPLDLSGKSSRSPTDMKELNVNRPPTPVRSPSNLNSSNSNSNSPKRENINKNNPSSAAQTQTILSIAQTLAQKHHLQQQQQQQQQSKKQKQMPPPSGTSVLHSKSSANQSSSSSSSLNSLAHSLSPPMIPMPTPSPPGNFNPLRNLVTLSDAASCLHKLSNNSLNSSLNQLVAAAAAGLCPPGHTSSSALSPPAPQMLPPQNPLLPSNLTGMRGNALSPSLASTAGNSPLNYPKPNLLSPTGWPAGMNLPRGLLGNSLGRGTGTSLSPPLSNHLYSSLTGPSPSVPTPSSGSTHPHRGASLRIPNPNKHKESISSTPSAASGSSSKGENSWSPMNLFSKGLADNNKSLISGQAAHILRSSSLTSSGNSTSTVVSSGRHPKINGNISALESMSSSTPTTFVAPSAIKPMSKTQGQISKNAIPNSMKISNFLPPPQSKANGSSSSAPATITSSSSNLAKYLSNLPPLMPPQSPPHNQASSSGNSHFGSGSNSSNTSSEKARLKSNAANMNLSSHLNSSSFTYPLSSSILNANPPGGILPPKNFTSSNNLMSARTLPVSVATAGLKASKAVDSSDGNTIGFTLSIENNSPNNTCSSSNSNIMKGSSRGATQPQNQAVRHIPNPSLLLSNRQNNNSICQSLLTSNNNNAVKGNQITVPKPTNPYAASSTTNSSSSSSSSSLESSSFSISNLTGKGSSQRPLAEEIGKIEKIVQEKKEMLQELGKSAKEREPISDMEKILEELRKIPFERIQAQKEAEKLLAQKEGERAHALREAEKERNQREAAEKLRKELLEKAAAEKEKTHKQNLISAPEPATMKTDKELVKIQMEKEAGKIRADKAAGICQIPKEAGSLSQQKEITIPALKEVVVSPQKDTAIPPTQKDLGGTSKSKDSSSLEEKTLEKNILNPEAGKIDMVVANSSSIELTVNIKDSPPQISSKIPSPKDSLKFSQKSTDSTKQASERVLFHVDKILEAIEQEKSSGKTVAPTIKESSPVPLSIIDKPKEMPTENVVGKSHIEIPPSSSVPAEKFIPSEEIQPLEKVPEESVKEKPTEVDSFNIPKNTIEPMDTSEISEVNVIPEVEAIENPLASQQEQQQQEKVAEQEESEEKALITTPIPEVIPEPNNHSIPIIPSASQVETTPVPDTPAVVVVEEDQLLTLEADSSSQMSKADESMDEEETIRKVDSLEKKADSNKEKVDRADEEEKLLHEEQIQNLEQQEASIEVTASSPLSIQPTAETENVTLNQLEESPTPTPILSLSQSIPSELPIRALTTTTTEKPENSQNLITSETTPSAVNAIQDNILPQDNVISVGDVEMTEEEQISEQNHTETIHGEISPTKESQAPLTDSTMESMEESLRVTEPEEEIPGQCEQVQDSTISSEAPLNESQDSNATTEESTGEIEMTEEKLAPESSESNENEVQESQEIFHKLNDVEMQEVLEEADSVVSVLEQVNSQAEESSAEVEEAVFSSEATSTVESIENAEETENLNSEETKNVNTEEVAEELESEESLGVLIIEERAESTEESVASPESVEETVASPENTEETIASPESVEETVASPEETIASPEETVASPESTEESVASPENEQTLSFVDSSKIFEPSETEESIPEAEEPEINTNNFALLLPSTDSLLNREDIESATVPDQLLQSEEPEAFIKETIDSSSAEDSNETTTALPSEIHPTQPEVEEDSSESVVIPEIPKDFDESSDDLIIDAEALGTPSDSTDGTSTQTELSPIAAPLEEENQISQSPSESEVQAHLPEQVNNQIPSEHFPTTEDQADASEPMEIDSEDCEPLQFNSSPQQRNEPGKIPSEREIIEKEAVEEKELTARSSIDGNDLPNTQEISPEEKPADSPCKSIIIPDKSYNLPSALSQVPEAIIETRENPIETTTYAIATTREEESKEESSPPPKMLSPKQESILIKKELLENLQDEDSMETDPFLHPNLELPMDVDEDEKDMKPLPIVLTKTDEEERTASELSFVPSDIPEDHQQPFLVEAMNTDCEAGLLENHQHHTTVVVADEQVPAQSSPSQQPGSPIQVGMPKMENLEKVAAGLLASAANTINNNNNNSFTNSGVGLTCDIPIGTATTTV